ncbi:NOV, partial [Symbiodinium sp. CCMP2592]
MYLQPRTLSNRQRQALASIQVVYILAVASTAGCGGGVSRAALDGNDARRVAATVLARLLADGAHMPVQKFEASISQWMKRLHQAEEETALAARLSKDSADVSLLSCEVFLLRAISALPREARADVGNILASPYVHLRRPRSRMAQAAKMAPEFCIAARWLGEHFGILEWTELHWETYYDSTAVAAAPSRPCVSVHSVPGADEATMHVAATAADGAKDEQRSSGHAKSSVLPRLPGLSEDDPNVRLCSDIARLKAVDLADVDQKSRTWRPGKSVDETTRSLQLTVQGAVKRLAADLYSTETHFLLELLQNVDDCRFVNDEVPKLRLIMEDNSQEYPQLTSLSEGCFGGCVALLALEYNETGFEESNVRALCDIAQSTKTSEERKYIGAKGIGFKSVFRVTDTPIVHSGDYHFHFDKNALDGLGYLIPFPLARPANFGEPGGCRTRVVLPLKEATRVAEVRTHVLEDIQPTLLLFLRNLCTIEVVDSSAGLRKHMTKEIANTTVTLRTTASQPAGSDEVRKLEQWRMHTHRINVNSSESVIQTELKLAFRLDDLGTGPGPLAEKSGRRPELQQAFAWLPLRSYGFRFIIHADWVVPSSREAIVENDPFNQTIRDELPGAFATAIQAMLSEMIARLGTRVFDSRDSLLLASEAPGEAPDPSNLETLQRELSQLYEVVPVPGDAVDFFAPTPFAILQELRHVSFVLARAAQTSEETARLVLVRPGEAVRGFMPEVPTEWADKTGMLEPLLNAAGYFMEMDVISGRLSDALRIPPLNSNVAMDCLVHFHRRASQPLSDQDLEQLHLLLLIISADTSSPLARLSRMPIVPTEAGHLVIPENENVYNVGVDFQGVIPGAQTLHSRFAKLMHQRVAGLLHRTGVEHAEGLQFFKQVLAPFLTSASQPGVEELLQCTRAARRFLQSSEHVEDLTPLLRSGLWVVSDCQQHSGQAGHSSLVCWCSPETPVHLTPLPERLRQVYQQKWLYVSPAYIQREPETRSWQNFWTSIGVWPAFAVAADGTSLELQGLLRCLSCTSDTSDNAAFASALVSFLGPHGEVYAPHCQADGGSQSAAGTRSPVLQLLETTPWLPTRAGELVRIEDSWIPSSPPLALEEPFVFITAVAELKKTWPFLSFKAAASSRNLISIIRKQAASQRTHSVQDWRCLYGRLMHVLDVSDTESAETQETINFLQSARWIFVPEHPRLLAGKRDPFDDRGAAVPRNGQFCSVAEVVFKDDSRLVDTYSKACTDEASDFARAACGKRIVGQYYWGPYTLFPPNWTGQRYTPQHAEVQELFSRLGVQQFLQWSDFHAILASISDAVEKEVCIEQDPVMVCAAVHVFGHLADEVEHELFDSEGSYTENSGRADGGMAARPEATSAYAASPTLKLFLEGAQSLRCVPTAGGSWATLQEVHFVYDPQHMSSWQGESLRLVAGLKNYVLSKWEVERLNRAFGYCGLSAPVVSRQARVQRWQRGKEAALAAGLLLAAVRWLLEDGTAVPEELAEVLRTQGRQVEFIEALPADEGREEEDAPVQL